MPVMCTNELDTPGPISERPLEWRTANPEPAGWPTLIVWSDLVAADRTFT
jgi:hypothetical protein